ncbi:MAG: hypothetical protein HYV15_08000, partial [Elusimicrobia bacterium]|nr:hypothetical protein [Elusimicrobiota bacterium]
MPAKTPAAPAAAGFEYEDPFPLGPDGTKYRLVSKDGVRVERFNRSEVLVVEPEALA